MAGANRYRLVPALVLVVLALINMGIVLAASKWDKNDVDRVNLAGEGFLNANRTGYGYVEGFSGYLRSLEGEKVHSRFSLNSNSCASCHLTHTAPGKGLLFQRSVYNTCTTCHFDGTMNAYNVLSGEFPGGGIKGGGRFFDGEFLNPSDRKGVSFHLTTGQKQHWQAPGSGITAAQAADWAVSDPDNPWLEPFTCGSCHGPHGTYSGRHLHYNPNGWVQRQGSVTAALVPVAGRPGSYTVTDRSLIPWYYSENPAYRVIVTGYLNGQYGEITDRFVVNYAEGTIAKADSGDAAEPVSVTFYRAQQVKMDITNRFGTEESVVYTGGVTEFCASCHTAYLDGSDFTDHNSFRHAIDVAISDGRALAVLKLEQSGGQNRLTCLTCHYAHGTDLALMQKRGVDWETGGGLEPLPADTELPSDTRHLRFFNPAVAGTDGRWEACFICHGDFAVTGTVPDSSDPEVVAEVLHTEQDRVEVFFNFAPDPVTFQGNFTVTDPEHGPVEGEIVFLPGERKASFMVDGLLQAGREYLVELTAGIRSRLGSYLKPYSFVFRTVEVPAEEMTGEEIAGEETPVEQPAGEDMGLGEWNDLPAFSDESLAGGPALVNPEPGEPDSGEELSPTG